MPENDANYGSQFRTFPPISSGLRVEAGEAKPARTRQKQATYKMEPISDIKRGNRDNTAWSRIKAGRETASTQGEGGEMVEIGNDAAEQFVCEYVEEMEEAYEMGLLDDEEFSEALDMADEYISESNSNIIS
jgi:hypothetical protein